VLKHNSQLYRASQEGKELSVELRDQGLTRPKVLILVPFRDSAHYMVTTISKLLIEESQVCGIYADLMESWYNASKEGFVSYSKYQ